MIKIENSKRESEEIKRYSKPLNHNMSTCNDIWSSYKSFNIHGHVHIVSKYMALYIK